MPKATPQAQDRAAAFRESLQTLGWVEGRNIRIDTRWTATSDAPAMQRFAKELVALHPDLILSHNTPTTAAFLRQTRSIPIVFAVVSDPIGTGFAQSFSRPGGNITGFTNIEPTMPGKCWSISRRLRRASPTKENVPRLITAWQARSHPTVFDRMATHQ